MKSFSDWTVRSSIASRSTSTPSSISIARSPRSSCWSCVNSANPSARRDCEISRTWIAATRRPRSGDNVRDMHAAIYVRVAAQGDDDTCAAQLAGLRTFAQVMGWSTSEYVDRGFSGVTRDRPELNRLIVEAKAKPRSFDIMLCWTVDRLSRTIGDTMEIISELNSFGISFLAVGETAAALYLRESSISADRSDEQLDRLRE